MLSSIWLFIFCDPYSRCCNSLTLLCTLACCSGTLQACELLWKLRIRFWSKNFKCLLSAFLVEGYFFLCTLAGFWDYCFFYVNFSISVFAQIPIFLTKLWTQNSRFHHFNMLLPVTLQAARVKQSGTFRKNNIFFLWLL